VKINGVHYRSIQPTSEGPAVQIIDQTRLPHEFVMVKLDNLEGAARAIKTMQVRGAPLIGATAAYGIALTMRQRATDAALDGACQVLLATRPTAVNLRRALDKMRNTLKPLPVLQRAEAAWREAGAMCDEDVSINRSIGEHGFLLIRKRHEEKRGVIQIMTHCNAGWLATVDHGTALAPIYMAFDAGIPIHVWVSETRPRNQGASLTAWELGQHGVPHTIIVDNMAGHLMQRGDCDMVIVGTDRTTVDGNVANKIGTYLKALAACDNGVPFYVALPGPSIDWDNAGNVDAIPIEERSADEVAIITGKGENGELLDVRLTPEGSPALNYAFDVTPARLVTSLITERGICSASREGLLSLYPRNGD
jgi:methylthioribose-1-phosphate isomerase